MKKHFLQAVVSFLLFVAARQPAAWAQCGTDGLDDGPIQGSSGDIDFDAEFDNGICNGGGDVVPQARAQDILNAVVASMGLFRGFGFAEQKSPATCCTSIAFKPLEAARRRAVLRL